MVRLSDLFHNYVLTVALISWLSAQILKTLINFIKSKKLNLERMVGAGGMPSAHTATVVSIVIAVARLPECGLSSPEFAIVFVLAAVVMYDAMGVRRAAGEQAKVLNYVREHWADLPEEFQGKKLNEHLGHTLPQVIMGALLGTAIGLVGPMIW